MSQNTQLINKKIFKFGERGSGFKVNGEPQDFIAIREECLRNNRLFEDPQFPPSLHLKCEWKRPKEIVRDPEFLVDGISRFDINQGSLGDCWFLAAVANITLHPHLVQRIVPSDQGFKDKYAGIFHFRFWQYGKWIDIVIDDRLPTRNGKLILMHSVQNEFWSALLEKAYAKLHGSYTSLEGGLTHDALEDFTGGLSEMLQIKNLPKDFYNEMQKTFKRGSMMGCCIMPDPNELEAKTDVGLVMGHAYSITKIQTITVRGKTVHLLRIRNPWGNDVEWKGAWSDESSEWSSVPDNEKKEIGLTFDNDGEFWMSYDDFVKYFEMLEICHVDPDTFELKDSKSNKSLHWQLSLFEGAWVNGVTAGGFKGSDTFNYNPQYTINLVDPDDEDDDDTCTLVVSLMQKNRRREKEAPLAIGYIIYDISKAKTTPLNKEFFANNNHVASSAPFINLRDTTKRFKLKPGKYCIIPSTYRQNEEAEFVLRVLTEHKNEMSENTEDVGYKAPSPASETDHEKQRISSREKIFLNIAGADKEVDWKELKKILDVVPEKELKTGFSKDVCRSMVAMLDLDGSGKLGFQEFSILLQLLGTWEHVWHKYDKDHSGTLSGFELRSALQAVGFNVTISILNAIMHRYGNDTGEIEFEDFIHCAIKLKVMFEIFQVKQVNGTGVFTLEEWLQNTLYT